MSTKSIFCTMTRLLPISGHPFQLLSSTMLSTGYYRGTPPEHLLFYTRLNNDVTYVQLAVINDIISSQSNKWNQMTE